MSASANMEMIANVVAFLKLLAPIVKAASVMSRQTGCCTKTAKRSV
jgi:hypothetical protein